jgi:hypothetical protein
MANPEHVEILKQGVEVWNKWREKNPNVRPDLRYIDLSLNELIDANLSNGDFFGANLYGGNFSRSDFRKATLNHVNFIRTDLTQVDFTGADLVRANCYFANLRRANLNSTNLGDVNLDRADLVQTNFSKARIRLTSFGGVNLSKSFGLDTVFHDAPSTIGIDTIILSQGNIPMPFLRGAGVPETFIEYARSLINNPIEYYTCFISHSSSDQDFANRLHTDLQDNGVRCWFAPHDMRIGDRIRPHIDESIRLYDKLLLILSQHSVCSQWVEHEVETAIGKELESKPNVLFPIRLDNAVMESKTGWAAHIKLTRNIGDFTKWKYHNHYQKAFERLLRDLKAEGKEAI